MPDQFLCAVCFVLMRECGFVSLSLLPINYIGYSLIILSLTTSYNPTYICASIYMHMCNEPVYCIGRMRPPMMQNGLYYDVPYRVKKIGASS